ncbi:methyltransferase domain-containing protein [Rothia uropygialis]|uniref:methyltransferase domain-containing protein n=1 Tax=Kocuria sp. 36 TaxID=1415402 RepID=UPI001EE95F63|nr:methyltransferase domain-containing protein [Kocuria sp. 36]
MSTLPSPDSAGAAQERTRWDPEQYLKFGSERARPLVDLLQRIPLTTVRNVVDLGCGPGSDTPVIHGHWPEAVVHGVDSSQQMIDAARVQGGSSARYERADVKEWLAARQVHGWAGEVPQLIVSNALFQWVDGHERWLPQVADLLPNGGVFAFQVPGNFDAPSHVLLREIAGQPKYARHIHEKLRDKIIRAREYLALLSRPGWSVDAWETTYLHVLQGEDPVFDWISSTGARPVLNALPEPVKSEFVDEYKAALRTAYPAEAHGTVMPFRRVFVVAARLAET